MHFEVNYTGQIQPFRIVGLADGDETGRGNHSQNTAVNVDKLVAASPDVDIVRQQAQWNGESVADKAKAGLHIGKLLSAEDKGIEGRMQIR